MTVSRTDELDTACSEFTIETLRIARIYEVAVRVNPLPRVSRDQDVASVEE